MLSGFPDRRPPLFQSLLTDAVTLKMQEESCVTEDGRGDSCVSIPRGGPIYITDMVGPFTRVSDFESAILGELQDLTEEINQDLVELGDYDLSVDELKIITEEELVNKAFKVAFLDENVTGNSSVIPEKHTDAGKIDEGRILGTEHPCLEGSGGGTGAASSDDTINRSLFRTGDNGELNQKNMNQRKRKRRINQNSGTLEESYMPKVKQLVRIKQKQDEDKAAARLHSFNGSCRINDLATVSSEKTNRITSLKSISSTAKVKPSGSQEHVGVRYPEIILCIEVYHNRRTWAKTQEFLVVGRQTLNELRDKIYCLTDEVMKTAGQHDPSGYFLIEDVFCNDLREPSAIDYSKPIRDWLRDSKKEALEKWDFILSGELQPKQKALLGNRTELNLPKFKAVHMHSTRFCDLRFRLGAGYLYCHQGDCKHVIVIRDMRLIHPEDVQNRVLYPVVSFQSKLRVRKCSVCHIFRAEKVTVDDKWAGENPCYFCGICYYMLHYVNGSLLYNDFSVYDYHHE